jgi:hypothetical protein
MSCDRSDGFVAGAHIRREGDARPIYKQEITL